MKRSAAASSTTNVKRNDCSKVAHLGGSELVRGRIRQSGIKDREPHADAPARYSGNDGGVAAGTLDAEIQGLQAAQQEVGDSGIRAGAGENHGIANGFGPAALRR